MSLVQDKQVFSFLKNRRSPARHSPHSPRRRLSATLALLLLLSISALSINARRVSSQAQGAVGKARVSAQQKGKAAFDGERAFAHIRRLVEFGPRPAGSKELVEARSYIVGELKSYGLKVSEDEFTAKTPAGERRMSNVTAELPGESADFIIVASHYDTKPFKEFRFVGANDGGSSTGELLELARALAASPRPRFTYRFVFFDGEEAFCRDWDECGKPGAPDNTYGSRRYVERLRQTGELKRLRALVLLDMMGYEKLEMGRDDMSTPWLAQTVWQAARELGYDKQFADRAEGVGGDDHEPFLKAGVPALDIIQLTSYPFWHTPGDTLDKISARSLQAVGDVLLASLPRIELKLKEGAGRE
ncbi:MAG TPA: M28 family peptidase [Pyrinomonadaceae bacterium]|nr:M28 family peptidase [Pyrinomonadaceae bacterium]